MENQKRLAMALMFCAVSQIAEADVRDRDALALARVCVHEAGFTSPDDCSAIHAVLARVIERIQGIRTIAAAAELYSPRATGRVTPRTDLDRWVQQLNLRATKPPAFGYSWELNRPRWIERLEQARRLLAGTESHRCELPITHWGAPSGGDLERATRARWTRVNCGETRNAFWRVGNE